MCQRFFSLLFAAKIERRSSDQDDQGFVAQFLPQTTGKNPLAPRVTLNMGAKKKKKIRNIRLVEEIEGQRLISCLSPF